MHLLDTDILVDILREQSSAVTWLNSLPDTFGVPGFVAMELYQGCRNRADVRDVDRLLKPLAIVWPTESDCRAALAKFPTLRLSHSLGLLDSLIAVTALGIGATLCTFNAKHFACVPGLLMEQPYEREP